MKPVLVARSSRPGPTTPTWADSTQQCTQNAVAVQRGHTLREARRLARRDHQLLDALILFRSALLTMCLTRMLTVLASMARVPAGSVCMMRSFLVMTALVVFGCFPVMTSSMRVVFRGFAMMLGGFFRHVAPGLRRCGLKD